ncbi:MAG: M15 family metallopeptidase [Actinomycetota bacterium]
MTALRAPVLAAGLAAVLALLTGCVPAEETTPSPSTTAASADPSEDATSQPVPAKSPKAEKKKNEGKAPGAREDHTDPSSIGVVVNKLRPLVPLDYHPGDLRRPAVSIGTGGESALLRDAVAGATEKMFAAAAADGAPMVMISGFRSYATQVDTYNHWVRQHGSVAAADMISARPGYSEHQTGLSMDVGDSTGACNLQQCFADTAAGIWVANNAARFGFIIRYSPGEEDVTGYSPEPWHLRYVGKKVAGQMAQRSINSLEEYFGLPPAPRYS